MHWRDSTSLKRFSAVWRHQIWLTDSGAMQSESKYSCKVKCSVFILWAYQSTASYVIVIWKTGCINENSQKKKPVSRNPHKISHSSLKVPPNLRIFSRRQLFNSPTLKYKHSKQHPNMLTDTHLHIFSTGWWNFNWLMVGLLSEPTWAPALHMAPDCECVKGKTSQQNNCFHRQISQPYYYHFMIVYTPLVRRRRRQNINRSFSRRSGGSTRGSQVWFHL